MTQLFIREEIPGKDIMIASIRENVECHIVPRIFNPNDYSLSDISRVGFVYENNGTCIPFGTTKLTLNDYDFKFFKKELFDYLSKSSILSTLSTSSISLEVDIITCSMSSPIFIDEVSRLKTVLSNVNINFSMNKTGGTINSDWITESNGVSIKDFYFTSNINNYNFSLGSSSYSCGFVDSDKLLWTFGANGSGQLGIGPLGNTETPTNVLGITNAKYVTCGASNMAVVTGDGNLYTFGSNSVGQLGTDQTLGSNVPVQIYNDNSVVFASAGSGHVAIIKTDGTVWVFGQNNNGQLGIGTLSNINLPAQILTPTITNAVHVACGSFHTAIVTADGFVYACGSNFNGQIGINTISFAVSTPTQMLTSSLTPISNAKYVACGSNHTIIVMADGKVFAVGDNSYGQFGDGTNTSTTTAVDTGITNAIYAACGLNHTLILLSTGAVISFGSGLSGQLGNNSTSDQNTPVNVSGITNDGISVAGGFNVSSVLKNDGTMVSFGDNTYGQLGIGTLVTTSTSTPLQVSLQPSQQVFSIYDGIVTFEMCIHEDNLVKTKRGLIPIKHVISGDIVYNESDKEIPVIFNIKMGRQTNKFIKISKNTFGNDIPSNDLYITNWHPIKHNDKEISGDELLAIEGVTNTELTNTVYVYCLCTDERIFVRIEDLMVCTREEKSWNEVIKDPNVVWSKQ
jgi:alpha-tubulin suppressor-like RCC1 family protein